jgi:hypothetical protein
MRFDFAQTYRFSEDSACLKNSKKYVWEILMD